MSQIREGQFVEAPVKIGGEPTYAIAVVKRLVDGTDGSVAVQVDFGPGVTTDDGGSSTLVWRDISTLRQVSSPSSKGKPLTRQAEQTTSKGASGPAAAARSATTPAVITTPSVRKAPEASTTEPANDEAQGPYSRPDHPTSIDQALWTLIAGMHAILECRRPLVSILFLIIASLYTQLVMPDILESHGAKPEVVQAGAQTCARITSFARVAPDALSDLVVHGRVPAGVSSVLNDLATGAFLKNLHDAIEHHQRTKPRDSVAPSQPMKKELGGKRADVPTNTKAEKAPNAERKKKKAKAAKPTEQTPKGTAASTDETISQPTVQVDASQASPVAAVNETLKNGADAPDTTVASPTTANSPTADEPQAPQQQPAAKVAPAQDVGATESAATLTAQEPSAVAPTAPEAPRVVETPVGDTLVKEVPKTAATPAAVTTSTTTTENPLQAGDVDRALCGRTADLCLALLALLVIGSTTAYPFANPRTQLAVAATKFKGLAYITAVLIIAFATLDSVAMRSLSPRPEWLELVYVHVLDVNTLTTFLLSHLSFNIVLHAVLTVLTGALSRSKPPTS